MLNEHVRLHIIRNCLKGKDFKNKREWLRQAIWQLLYISKFNEEPELYFHLFFFAFTIFFAEMYWGWAIESYCPIWLFVSVYFSIFVFFEYKFIKRKIYKASEGFHCIACGTDLALLKYKIKGHYSTVKLDRHRYEGRVSFESKIVKNYNVSVGITEVLECFSCGHRKERFAGYTTHTLKTEEYFVCDECDYINTIEEIDNGVSIVGHDTCILHNSGENQKEYLRTEYSEAYGKCTYYQHYHYEWNDCEDYDIYSVWVKYRCRECGKTETRSIRTYTQTVRRYETGRHRVNDSIESY